MSTADGQSWCPFQIISCDTEVKIRHAAHASTETKVNSTQFNQELYGVIYGVLRLDTWQETRSVCVCMPLSLCLWRADGGSGHTCPDREAKETPRSTPPTTNHRHLLSLVHKRPHMTSDPTGIHSDWAKVLTAAQKEQCSVVSERKRREGGREAM